ncbi:hypothetical protein [Thalassospira sp. MCCC 1A01428]|uniref:hypothetical protein n=1 Tax=Thalassospira sp. MCCC 1A01428 TaxID=1470575 RepID=UPI000A1E54D9|nr:hypothetical protein [Thalassospira sp. MCCC 1A01428]OSQ45889.1 hypothetical protein THS27_02335 [Thalassospira sp. MCCC 1A01428]
MKRHHLVLQAITSQDRHLVARQIQDALTLTQGWVEDARFYSNKMTTIRFTLVAREVPVFVAKLHECGLAIDDLTREGGGLSTISAQGDVEISGSIQITFLHNDPDLKQIIPAVPG